VLAANAPGNPFTTPLPVEVIKAFSTRQEQMGCAPVNGDVLPLAKEDQALKWTYQAIEMDFHDAMVRDCSMNHS
jgi:hypothetical protein